MKYLNCKASGGVFVMKAPGVYVASLKSGHLYVEVLGASRTLQFGKFKSRWVRKYRRMMIALNPFPVYYVTDGTDCDHYRVTSAGKASNGWKYLKARDDEYKWAEGPTSVYRITKKEYDEDETTRRDYVLEAFEDGHQHWVRR